MHWNYSAAYGFCKHHSIAEVSGLPKLLAPGTACSWPHGYVTWASDLTSLYLSVLVPKMDNFLGCYED